MSKEFTNTVAALLDTGGESLRSIFNEHRELLQKAEDITIDLNSHESYENAVELKRVLKKTHIAIETKRKEFRAEIMKMARNLDNYSDDFYQPFREAELKVKQLCDDYDAQKKTVRKQKGKIKKEELKKQQEITNKLLTLNTQLSRINGAKELSELEYIGNVLDYNLNRLDEFGDKKDEAGFIISNLKVVLKNKRELLTSVETTKEEESPFKDDKDIVQENIKSPLDELTNQTESLEETQRKEDDEKEFEAIVEGGKKEDSPEQEQGNFTNIFEENTLQFDINKNQEDE